MNGRRSLQTRLLDQFQPGRFDEPVFPLDQILDEHAPGRDQIRNSGVPGPTCSRPRGPKENGVEMQDCEIGEIRIKSARERRRPIQSTKILRREISDVNTVECNWTPERDRAVIRTIDIGREYFHMVTSRRQRTTETMYRKNRSAIAHSRQIRWDYMQDAHHVTAT